MQYQIANDCLYASLDGKSEIQLVPNFLLKVYAQELHNSMVSSPEEGVLKKRR